MNIKTWQEMIELDDCDYDNLLNSRKKSVYHPYRYSTTKHKSTFGGKLIPSKFTYHFPHTSKHRELVSKWVGER